MSPSSHCSGTSQEANSRTWWWLPSAGENWDGGDGGKMEEHGESSSSMAGAPQYLLAYVSHL
jgi:hypothetical protein